MNILGIGVFLATTAAGYWVLTLADREGNRRARLGHVLGWGILAISLLGFLSQFIRGGRIAGNPGRGHSFFGHPGNGHSHGHWDDGGDGEK